MAQDEYGNEIDEPQRPQQGATNQVANAIGTGVAAPPKPQEAAGSTWLNWINSTYGKSGSRGGGFADLPQGQNLSGVVDRFNKETGRGAKFIGGASGDQVDFGQGAQDALTAEGQLWLDHDPGNPGGMKGGGGGGGGTGSISGSAVGGSGMGDMSGKSNALYDLLMKRASQSLEIDPNDPVIKGQTDAYDAQGQQARRNYLSASAEAEGAYGNAAGESRRSAEELGKSTGAFQAAAMERQQNARRQEIEHALSGAAGLLTEEQRLSLQEELSKMGMNMQNDQFGRSLAQSADQFGSSLGQRAYEYDNTRYDQLFGG